VLATLTFASPYLHLPATWLDIATFAGGAGLALASLHLLSHNGIPKTVQLAVGVAALCLWTLAAIALTPRLGAVVVGTALVFIGHLVGDAIGSRIEHPGHLLPACVVAGVADVASVLLPAGPTHAVVASERALALMTLSFPVLGTRVLAPVLGIGDIVFIALLLGAARKHALSRVRMTLLAAAGVALAGVASAVVQSAVPALPAIGLAAVTGFRPAHRLRPRDVRVAALFIAATLVVATAVVAARFLFPDASP
jgi:hypothetical protein